MIKKIVNMIKYSENANFIFVDKLRNIMNTLGRKVICLMSSQCNTSASLIGR